MEFVGHEVLRRQKAQYPTKRLVAFELLSKAVPRHGMKLKADGMEIGEISSGNFSPILQKGIGLGFVLRPYAEAGTSFDVAIRGSECSCKSGQTSILQESQILCVIESRGNFR